ncbi:hypothetical protein BH23ACT3_BH23ACT3_21000 [soil metagenome]
MHQYAAVDDHLVVEALDRLDEFERFVAEVSAWMLAPPTDSEAGGEGVACWP